MSKFCELTFKEFWHSNFVDECGGESPWAGWQLSSPESQIVDNAENSLWDQFGVISFYKKGAQRWVKKMEKSGEQLADDGVVYLMGDDKTGRPTHFQIDCDNDSFDFILSDEQVDWIRNRVETDFWTDEIIYKSAFE